MFYGRESELQKLEKLYTTNDFQCVILYGRRRVGKTTLIGEFCKDKKVIFFSALETTGAANLKVLSKAVNSYLYPDSKANMAYGEFEDVFTKIYETAQKEHIVFVIDEYPYLASSDKSISSELQHFIDHMFSRTNIFIILCGSSMSFMENQVLGYKSPLYGRRTAQFKLEPLTYLKTAEAHRELSKADNALIYGITGGIPHYINKLNVSNGLDEAIIEGFLDKTSYLFEEPNNLLKQELREPSVYNAIIAAIADGASKLNVIATKVRLESGPCSKYLSVLISLGIIGKKTPVACGIKNKVLYFIKDNLFNFWFRFVPENISAIVADKTATVYQREIKPYLNSYMGKIFENICLQYLVNFAENLPFIPREIGSWWGGNPETKQPEEIDIIAINGKDAIFCECKWENKPVELGVLDNLKRKADIFKQFSRKYYYLFSKSGFSSGVADAANKDNFLRLIDLDALYKSAF
ncbi:MAG: ATP-binding protein [Clostridiales bacterium]|jgi:AAA+ ATPase superfamily predicted ATPase|nr:ATP-binding protein [Clostridiales bacterium]